MEPKKNPAVDVHRYRSALLAGSLAFSILIMIGVFEWTTAVMPVKPRVDVAMLHQAIKLEYYPHNFKEEKPPRQKRIVNPRNIVEVKMDPQPESEEPEIEIEPEASMPIAEHIEIELQEEPVEETEFIFVEKMPEPEGGLDAFYKTLRKNLKYPPREARANMEGKVFVEFTVSKTGELINLKVIKGISEALDKEALRVVALTKWKPGKQRGVPVNVRMVQGITFALSRY